MTKRAWMVASRLAPLIWSLWHGTAVAEDPSDWAIRAEGTYGVMPDVKYIERSGRPLMLDLYLNQDGASRKPLVVHFHGGGWIAGSKEPDVTSLLPFLEAGWSAANVEYRLASVAPAPAAVEDARCALRWLISHAEEHKIDTTRIVLSGRSVGGQLALLTAMTRASDGFDYLCPGDEMHVAAVINWSGVADVAAMLAGPEFQAYAAAWIGDHLDRMALARRVSPVTYVRPGVPAVISVHGTKDAAAAYAQAERLHQALEASGVPQRLVTIPDGGHVIFSFAETRHIYRQIWRFLRDRKLLR